MADQSLGTLGQAPGATLAPRVVARPRKIRGSEVGRTAVSSQWIGKAGKRPSRKQMRQLPMLRIPEGRVRVVYGVLKLYRAPKFETPKLIARCSLEPSRCYPPASWLCIYPNGRNGTHPTTINGLVRSR